jgi:hypothetical protein
MRREGVGLLSHGVLIGATVVKIEEGKQTSERYKFNRE